MQERLKFLRTEIDQTDYNLMSKISSFIGWLQKLPTPPANQAADGITGDLFISYCLDVARGYCSRLENEFLAAFWTLIMGFCAQEKLPLAAAMKESGFRDGIIQITASLDERMKLALEVEACKRQSGGKIFNRDREITVINMAISNVPGGFGPLKVKLPAYLVTSIMITVINHCTKIELSQREDAN